MKTEGKLPNEWSKEPPKTVENSVYSTELDILNQGKGQTELDEDKSADLDKRFEWNRGAFSGPLNDADQEVKENLLKKEKRAQFPNKLDDEDGKR